jgi:hemolysin activation/secretion protein
VTWTRGRVKLAPDTPDPLDTQARFNKINLDLARVQELVGGFSLYGRFSSQSANQNLDSSEGMSVDGPSGVRAYPTGETSGDEGWLTQLELRYTQAEYGPYVFFDQGRVRVNEDGSGPRRTLVGYGVGLRYQRAGWRADLALAWRERGGRPADANEADARPRVWLSSGYQF